LYENLTPGIISEHPFIINATPAGMHPAISCCPNIPYNGITSNHLLYDLIYNPAETGFLKQGREQGARTINGLQMLHAQAELSYRIFMDERI
jgi:shikimate dehydrogenase